MLTTVFYPINNRHYLPNDEICYCQKSEYGTFDYFFHFFLFPPDIAMIIKPITPIINVKMKPKASLDKSNLIHSLHPVIRIVKKTNNAVILSLCFILVVFKMLHNGCGYKPVRDLRLRLCPPDK